MNGGDVKAGKSTIAQSYDQVSGIIAFEQGELDREQTVKLFQNLVDTGLAWKLQGSYGRVAKALIEAGEVTQ